MTIFDARNGIQLRTAVDGSVRWEAGSPPLKVTTALREFFLAERDAELGRWRSKIEPDVIVRDSHGDDLRDTEFINERTGVVTRMRRCESDLLGEGSPYFEFFAAHPEPKPWHDAKPGEVWVLTIDGTVEECFAHQQPHHMAVMFQTKHRAVFGSQATAITAGRRVWPEGDES